MDAATVREQVTMFDVLDRLGLEEPNAQGKIRCIFHEDNTPSLHVYEDHWYSYCCGVGGSVIDFVMQYFECSFRRALQYLSTSVDPLATEAKVERSTEPEVPDFTERFYNEPYSDPTAAELVDWVPRRWPYLTARDLEPFDVRPVDNALWVPHYYWDAAAQRLKITGIRVRAVPAGNKLAVKGSRFPGLYYPQRGNLYVQRPAVLVEGESDAWCMYRHMQVTGQRVSVFALPSGAGSWKPSMLGILATATVVYTALDMDKAGEKATEKIRRDLATKKVPTQVIHPPGGRVAEALADGWSIRLG